MSEPIVYIDISEVREGRLEELKSAIDELVAFVDAKVPRAISYGVYLNEEGTRMTVVQVHPDSESLEHHMEVGGPAFAKFRDYLELKTIEIYGQPSDKLLEQLQQKAQMLGDGRVAVHELRAGFARFGGEKT
jgi:hypothetical protein